MKLNGPLLTPYNEFINICSMEIESIWSFSLDADRRYIWTREYIGVLPGTFSTWTWQFSDQKLKKWHDVHGHKHSREIPQVHINP